MTGPTLTAWQGVSVFLGTLTCSALCIVVPFWIISRNDKLTDIFARSGAVYIRYVTVILVIWSAAALAMLGVMSEGPSTLFGMVAGYVFGVQNRQHPPDHP